MTDIKMKNHLSLALAFSIALAQPLAAQVIGGLPTERGAWSGAAHAFSLGTGNELFEKVTGDMQSPPMPLQPQGSSPDYRVQSMFPGVWPLIEIDAFSTGNDLLPISSSGEISLGNDRWAALILSVDNDAHGQPGTWLAERSVHGSGPGLGADLLGYYARESVGVIGPFLAGRGRLEQSAEVIGLTPGSEIDALDLQAAMLTMNQGQGESPLFPNDDVVYFSLTSSSANDLGGMPWWGSGIPSGGSVLTMTWNGTAWDPTVTVQWSYDALGLQFVENVDAIAVNHVAGTLIFSTDAQTNLQPRDQLQVLLPGQTTPLTLVENGGHSIGGPVGIQPTDDIDAVCVIDPEVANANRWLGEPLTKKLPLFQMPLSISRYEDGKNVWSVVQITGVPSHAVDVVLEASLNQGGNYYPLGVYSGGPTVQCAFDLAGLPSMPIQFRAHARDSSGGTLSTSWVSRTQF